MAASSINNNGSGINNGHHQNGSKNNIQVAAQNNNLKVIPSSPTPADPFNPPLTSPRIVDEEFAYLFDRLCTFIVLRNIEYSIRNLVNPGAKPWIL